MRRRVLVALTIAGLGLAGCTGATSRPADRTSTRTEVTTVGSRPPSSSGASFRPAPASSRPPLRPGARVHAGETAGPCPYIKAGLNLTSGSGVNVADIEGDRVGRTTRLTGLRPEGCRFYFAYPDYEPVAEIRPQTFPDATSARNAMVLTARAGKELIVERGFVPGVDGICFRTRFNGPDKDRDWAFVFAKGRTLVTVYTQVTVSSRNAFYLAKAVVGRF